MSIQKKSLISTLKTAKKANVASTSSHEVDAKGSKVASMRLSNRAVVSTKQAAPKSSAISFKQGINFKNMKNLKNMKYNMKNLKSSTTKAAV
jgi:sulfite reductase alpha subunit-like flavoprotein